MFLIIGNCQNHQPFFLPNRQVGLKCDSKASMPEKENAPLQTKPLSPSPIINSKPPIVQTIGVKKSILKNSENNLIQKSLAHLSIPSGDLIFKRLEKYREKTRPRERMEIDILPSYLNCCNNKLLIASSSGKIRVIDLVNYKIQKDELKNILINGIKLLLYFKGVYVTYK